MILVIIFFIMILLVTLGNMYIYYYIPKQIGPSGPPGIQGDTGIIGDIGDIGDIGPRGYQGPKGIYGKDEGIKGKKGPKGLKGPIGNIGPIGKKGLQGNQGIDGNTGVTGDKGSTGKKGFQGLDGKNRIIKESDLRLIADKRKCIKLDDKDTFLKCPKNMAVFNIENIKKGDKTSESKINSITCCKFDISNPEYDMYFTRFDIPFLAFEIKKIRDQIKLYQENNSPNNLYYQYFKNYNNEDFYLLSRNLDLISDLISNYYNRKSPRDLDYNILLNMFNGDNVEAMKIKIYTSEKENEILKSFDSLTTYELYILQKISGFKKIKLRKGSSEDDIDIGRIIKEFHDFPFNDIDALEKDNILSKKISMEFDEESEFFENIENDIDIDTESSY